MITIPGPEILILVHDEFKSLGYKIDVNQKNLKESYNISKESNGLWFKSFKLTHHSPGERNYLNLEKMPHLKILTEYILEIDPDLDIKETIIYITQDSIFKVKKGSSYPYKLGKSKELESRINQKYQKLCDEMASFENTRDESRTEETYVVSKDNKGLWFRSGNIKKINGHKKHFNIEEMPNLKLLATKLNKQDPIFRENGGRVFITPSRLYRVKNSIEIEITL